mmetsp:Transcript_153330/g.491648  ORF Transcript_153330/g.491648 Transcript_153330/m.491648 type:complete len:333 (-) Transcript_153330:495-1493(-)
MEDARFLGTKSVWDAIHADDADDFPKSARTGFQSARHPIADSPSLLPPLVLDPGSFHGSRGSSLASRSFARSRCTSITSSRGSRGGSNGSAALDLRGPGSTRSISSSGQHLLKPSQKYDRSCYSSKTSCGSDGSASLGDDFDVVARAECIAAVSKPTPPPLPPLAKLPSVVGQAWVDASEATRDLGQGVFDDDDFYVKGSKSSTHSRTDDELFSPCGGFDDAVIPSWIPNEKAITGRRLPPMEQVVTPLGPPQHRARRPVPMLVDAACRRALGQELEEDEDEERIRKSPPPALAAAVAGSRLVPEEPKGPRPANRRLAHTKTAAARPLTTEE